MKLAGVENYIEIETYIPKNAEYTLKFKEKDIVFPKARSKHGFSIKKIILKSVFFAKINN